MNHQCQSNVSKDHFILGRLCQLLEKSGNKILKGESKLAITAECLSILESLFNRLGNGEETEQKSFTGRNQQQISWKREAEFLQDFFSKTPGVKIMNTSTTLQGGIHINRFTNLRVLEMKKVPMHLVEGIQKLRGQLVSVTASRCLQNLQDLFELCGGDMSLPMSWPDLKSANLSFNGIEILDGSLRLLHSLQILDLSHNNLKNTENYLEYLTDLQRLNLGFNYLDVIPSFSLSAKAKLKTLVLRNNNLDNIHGVEELLQLEDLDVSENCLADHSKLQVLINLNRLRNFRLIGNPISHHRDHRVLTLCYVSPIALQKQFELDRKLASTSEIKHAFILVKQQSVSVSRQPSSISHNAVVHNNRHGDQLLSTTISSEYSFHDSDDIATSLPVKSNSYRKIKKHSKLKSCDLDSSVTEDSSMNSSRASSPTLGNTINDRDVVQTQEEVELLRNHYGPNWLQIIGDKFQDSTQSEASNSDADNFTSTKTESSRPANQNGLANKQTNQKAVYDKVTSEDRDDVKQAIQKEPTEDDLYLKETFTGASITENKFGNIVAKSVKEQDNVDTRCDLNGDIKVDLPVTKSSSYSHRSDSGSGIDWSETKTEEENRNSYGEESEPFIVQNVQKNYEQLIVATNDRFLTEKNLNGIIVEELDLRSLMATQRWEEVTQHELMEDRDLMTHIKLTFDYIHKDRKERIYVMEDDTNANRFENLLHPFLAERELKSQPNVIFQCLKCSHHFTKTEAKKSTDNQKMPSSGSSLDLENLKHLACIRYYCSKCHSDKIIEVEMSSGSQASSSTSTPVGSYSSGNYLAAGADIIKKLSPVKNRRSSLDSQGTLKSPLAKSAAPKQNGITDEQTGPVNKNVTKELFSENSKTRNEGFNTQNVSDYHESHFCPSDIKIVIPRERSWAELQEVLKKEQRVRIASVDSDITVLTNPSECSISVISETSSENDNTKSQTVRFGLADTELAPVSDSIAMGNSPRNKDEITPLGSPLSNSICSSMVSSVYQNSVVEADDNITDTSTLVNQSSADDLCVYDVDSTEQSSRSIYDYNVNDDDGGRNDQSKYPVFLDTSTDVHVEKKFQGENNPVDVVSRERCSAILEQPYVDIDHRLKLHLMMTLFEDTEEFECIFRCDVSQYMIEEEFRGIFIMTSAKFYILKVAADTSSENPGDWLKTVDIQPIPELRYIDVGLGCQSFRLEYRTECSCYDFIVRDEHRCKMFVDFLEGLIIKSPLNKVYKKLGVTIHKDVNPASLDRLQKEVLRHTDSRQNSLVKYLMGYLVRGHNPHYPISFVISNSEICLVRENHQWPQPRLQAPLSEADVGKQFTVLERQAINNIATVEICAKEKKKIRMTFFNEKSGDETDWHITMETSNGTQSLVEAIRKPWESAFGVDLEITMVTFEDV